MYTQETKTRKNCIACCFGLSAIIFLVIGGLFAERSVNATMINADFNKAALIANAPKIVAALTTLCPNGIAGGAAAGGLLAGAAAAGATAAATAAGAAALQAGAAGATAAGAAALQAGAAGA